MATNETDQPMKDPLNQPLTWNGMIYLSGSLSKGQLNLLQLGSKITATTLTLTFPLKGSRCRANNQFLWAQ